MRQWDMEAVGEDVCRPCDVVTIVCVAVATSPSSLAAAAPVSSSSHDCHMPLSLLSLLLLLSSPNRVSASASWVSNSSAQWLLSPLLAEEVEGANDDDNATPPSCPFSSPVCFPFGLGASSQNEMG
jgi:hypothetical protein